MTAPNPTLPIDPLVAKLRTEAAASTGGGVALIGGGVVVSFLVVLMLVILLWLTFGLGGVSFTGWVAIVAVIYAAGGFGWVRTRGRFFAATTFEYVDPRQEWAGVGRYGGGAAAIPFGGLDWLFIGPRMLHAGVMQTENAEPPSRERFFDRCALMLRQLGRAGEAVKADFVRIGDDETAAKLSPVVNYLDRTGWIGLSSDRGRVWLSSRAKVELMQMGLLGVPGEE